jgi:putative ABC transport system ATP-binding protein
MGPSGSGKSTLLHLVAAMDVAGEIRVLGQDLRALNTGRSLLTTDIQLHFQSFNLIPGADCARECRAAAEAYEI